VSTREHEPRGEALNVECERRTGCSFDALKHEAQRVSDHDAHQAERHEDQQRSDEVVLHKGMHLSRDQNREHQHQHDRVQHQLDQES